MRRRRIKFGKILAAALVLHSALAVVVITRRQGAAGNGEANQNNGPASAPPPDLTKVQWLDTEDFRSSRAAPPTAKQSVEQKSSLPAKSSSSPSAASPTPVVARRTSPAASGKAATAAKSTTPAASSAVAKAQKPPPPRPDKEAKPAPVENRGAPHESLHPKAEKVSQEAALPAEPAVAQAAPPPQAPAASPAPKAQPVYAQNQGTGENPGASPGGGAAQELDAYHSRIQSVFSGRWRQPKGISLPEGGVAAAKVSIRIARDGQVSSRQLVQSSGIAEVDASALEAARGVERIDPLPSSVPGDSYRVVIRFELH
jgi:TonB family protein